MGTILLSDFSSDNMQITCFNALMYFVMEMEDPVQEMWIHRLNADRAMKGEFYNLYPGQRHFPRNSLNITEWAHSNSMRC